MGSKEDPMYLATTDYPYPQRFDINTLDTMELLRPKNGMGTSGCAHWQREPGTDNSIVFAHKVRKYFQTRSNKSLVPSSQQESQAPIC